MIVIDFETYFDNEYSLSKITTWEYITDDRFQTMGFCALDTESGRVWSAFGNDDAIAEALAQLPTDCTWVAHHAAFDGAILSWRYKIRPARWFCTKSAARMLHAPTQSASLAPLADLYNIGVKGTTALDMIGRARDTLSAPEMRAYEKYCMQDVKLTRSLADIFIEKLPPVELAVIDATIKAYTVPRLRLDVTRLREYHHNACQRTADLLLSVGCTLEDIRKDTKLAALLRARGVEPPTKVNAAGETKMAFAKTDQGMQDLLDSEDAIVSTLAEARLAAKSTIAESRAGRFVRIHQRLGALPVPLSYADAHTHRWTGWDKINLQNLPGRKDKTLRQCITVPTGHKLVVLDLKAIELYVCHFLCQEVTTGTLREGGDLYREFAAHHLYHVDVADITSEQRQVGKVAELSLQFGAGASSFDAQAKASKVALDVSPEDVVATWRQARPAIVATWRAARQWITHMSNGQGDLVLDLPTRVIVQPNRVVLPSGNVLFYDELRCEAREWRYRSRRNGAPYWHRIYPAALVQNIVQALARDIMAVVVARASARVPIVHIVHDELVTIAKDGDVEKVVEFLTKCASKPISWWPHIPVRCEIGVGATYGDAK